MHMLTPALELALFESLWGPKKTLKPTSNSNSRPGSRMLPLPLPLPLPPLSCTHNTRAHISPSFFLPHTHRPLVPGAQGPGSSALPLPPVSCTHTTHVHTNLPLSLFLTPTGHLHLGPSRTLPLPPFSRTHNTGARTLSSFFFLPHTPGRPLVPGVSRALLLLGRRLSLSHPNNACTHT